MTADLALPITIHGLETIRAPDGLALSSRNGYLSAEQRAVAPALYRIIQDTGARIKNGEPDLEALCERARTALSSAGLRPDYFGIAAANTLTPAQPADRELVILAAAFLGSTRLIDNLRVSR
jgi:pantoate--beta-alanine ligase